MAPLSAFAVLSVTAVPSRFAVAVTSQWVLARTGDSRSPQRGSRGGGPLHGPGGHWVCVSGPPPASSQGTLRGGSAPHPAGLSLEAKWHAHARTGSTGRPHRQPQPHCSQLVNELWFCSQLEDVCKRLLPFRLDG